MKFLLNQSRHLAKAGRLSSSLVIATVWLSAFAWLPAQGQPSGNGVGWGIFSISENPRCTNIASGFRWPLAIQDDGRLRNLGDYLPPSVANLLTNVVGVAGGSLHNLAVRADGSVVAWGDNTYGQTNVPAGLSNIIAVAAGGDYSWSRAHSIALRADGRVFFWGSSSSGQSSFPSSETNIVAIAAGSGHSLFLRSNGTVFVSGSGTPVHYWATDVAAIAAAGSYNLALRRDGIVIAWGPSYSYFPNGLSNAAAIALGPNHALVLRSNGTVRAWAITSSAYSTGQTNTPPDLTNVVAIAAGEYFSLALKSDGSLVAWGDVSVPAPVSNVVSIATGGFANAALTRDGRVINWGSSPWVPTNLNQISAISVAEGQGGNQGLALKPDGTVAVWGKVFPNSGIYASNRVPSGLNNVKAIAAGRYHNLALKSNGTVVSWRWNSSQFSSFVPDGLTNVTAIAVSGSVGHIHVNGGGDTDDYDAFKLALKSDGTVVSWNESLVSRIISATNIPAGLNNAIAIAAGGYHALALRADQTVVAWSAWPYVGGVTNVPAGLTNVVAIAAGIAHSLALKSDGHVVAWGNNSYGQTNFPAGLSNVIAIAAGGYQSLALTADLHIHSFGLSNQIPTLSFQTFAGQSYQIESTTDLSDANWEELPASGISGDGRVQSIADTHNPTNAPARYYRVRQH